MFHFINKKPFLKDLIPPNHIDIHSHLLPGIDDGAVTIEDTDSLISQLQQMGIDQFITTPHVMKNVWENTKLSIESKFENTLGQLKNDKPLRMTTAAEYLMDASFSILFQNEALLVLKENYVLVEMSYINPPIQLFNILFDLQVAGYQPVLAHPERYSFYHQSPDQYEKLKNAGCLFQLNFLSLIGYYGPNVTRTAEKLLKKNMIDFVGTDVHHQNHIDGFSKRVLFKPLPNLKEAIANNEFFRF